MVSMKEKAFELAEEMFNGKVDKGGNSYMNHLTRVASKMKSDTEKTIALLHDIIEDTGITKDDLLKMGFPIDVVEAVDILSRQEYETYNEFIDRILNSKNKSAIKVKIADLEDNMDLNRISTPTTRDINRVEKRYKPAHIILVNGLNEL